LCAEAEKAEADEGEWAADFKEGAEAAAGAPVASIDDLKEALLLVEVWRGEVAGGVLTKAGTTGEVRRRLAPYGISSALFRLLPSPALVVNACLQTAAVNKAHSAPVGGARGFDLAATLSGAPMDTAYLRYG